MNFFEKRPVATACALFLILVAFGREISASLKIVLLVALPLALILLFLIRRKHEGTTMLLPLLCVACVLAIVISYRYHDVYLPNVEGHVGEDRHITAIVENVTLRKSYQTVCEVNVIEVDGEKCDFGCYLVAEYAADVKRVGVIECRADICMMTRNELIDRGSYYNSKGIVTLATSDDEASFVSTGKTVKSVKFWFADLRDSLAERMSRYIKGDDLDFCRAVVLGDRSTLNAGIRNNFSRVGISHMLALSGMHLSIFIGSLLMIMNLFSVKNQIAHSIAAVVCVFYVIFTGASLSVLRAGIMFGVYCASILLKRLNDSVSALFIAVTLIVAFAPYTINNAGLLMSFSSTLGITVIIPAFEASCRRHIKDRKRRKIVSFLLAPIVTTLSALTFSIPIFTLYYDYISVLTVLSNIAVSVPLSLLLMICPLMLLVSFVFPAFAGLLGWACGFTSELILGYAAKFARLKHITYRLDYPFVKYIVLGMFIAVAITIILRLKSTLWYLAVLAAATAAYAVLFNIWSSQFALLESVCFVSEKKNDIVIVADGGEVAVCEITSGSKAARNMAFNDLSDIYFHEVADSYVFTHYHKRCVVNIEDRLSGGYIKTVYSPIPVSDEDKEYCAALSEMCKKHNIEHKLYGNGVSVSVGNAEIDIGEYATIKRSKHPAVALTLTLGDKKYLYTGGAVAEYQNAVDANIEYDVAFAGAHGAKIKTPQSYPAKYKTLIASEAGALGLDEPEPPMVLANKEPCVIASGAVGMVAEYYRSAAYIFHD